MSVELAPGEPVDGPVSDDSSSSSVDTVDGAVTNSSKLSYT